MPGENHFLALPGATRALNGAVPVSLLSRDVGNAAMRAPRAVPIAAPTAAQGATSLLLRFVSRGCRATHLGARRGQENLPKTSQPCGNGRQQAAWRARVGERCQGLGWKQPALCRRLPGRC